MKLLKKYRLHLFFVLFALIASCERQSNYNKAFEYYHSLRPTRALILLENSTIPKEIYLQGEIYLNLNDPRRALKSFERLIDTDPRWKTKVLKKLLQAGNESSKKGKDFMAVMIYSKILEFEGEFDLQEKNILMGNWFFDSGDYEQSIDYYIKGINYEPRNEDLRLKLARCYINTNDLVSAYDVLKEAIKDLPGWRLRYWLGKTAFDLAEKRIKEGNYDSAELYLKELISLGMPKVLIDDAYFLMGDIKLSREEYTDAANYYNKVLDLNKFAKPKIRREAEEALEIIKNMEDNP
ncbi:tetratricopeptide repeat protein [candidate division WOR-3 bacterium]|nr:tetratricopeptide repeat protein [candidate division WOR-3 bacterium]